MKDRFSAVEPRGRTYAGAHLDRVAFPMGGIGAGMVCLEGTGAFSHLSVRHRPDLFNEPLMFAALHLKGLKTSRIMEGPPPLWKCFGRPGAVNGGDNRTWGVPRFQKAAFTPRFPFATVELEDQRLPVSASITGWSPFCPGDPDRSSLPVAAVEYTVANRGPAAQDVVFSFHAENVMLAGKTSFFLTEHGRHDLGGRVAPIPGGFLLSQPPVKDEPAAEGYFTVSTTARNARVDCAWFRGFCIDSMSVLWKSIESGAPVSQPPYRTVYPGSRNNFKSCMGGSIYVPLRLPPRASRTVTILLSWYVPRSDYGYEPWYRSRFRSVGALTAYWRKEHRALRRLSAEFSECFHDTTLPDEVVDAVSANLSILKSPTCLRQRDGRFWAWEGSGDREGCCGGSCTHVWNYAQALPHLFPSLERTLRETEFLVNQDERGHQAFRGMMPISPPKHDFPAAADGQLGGIMRVYREWRISGDTAWMRSLWPRVRAGMDYCISTWDPNQEGLLTEPHHTTLDTEFWGADSMCVTMYLGALTAAASMGDACGGNVKRYRDIAARGRQRLERDLWNGQYFEQGPYAATDARRHGTPTIEGADPISPEARAIIKKEGPKYQYGTGCLSDGVLGDWVARCCGLPGYMDAGKVASHLRSVYRYNFRKSLRDVANLLRPNFAFPNEGGLILCSWPRGGRPTLPFYPCEEVWSGVEYDVASHLIMTGRVAEGLEMVRTTRARYDGRYRNPFNEYECGYWYARSLSSYALLQALSGARYDAVEKTLYLEPVLTMDYRAFLCTETGYGTLGMRDGQPFLEVVHGRIEARRICVVRDGKVTVHPRREANEGVAQPGQRTENRAERARRRGRGTGNAR